MIDHQIARREALSALLIAPVALAAVPAIAGPASASKWKEALDHYRAVDAAWNHFLETVQSPAHLELARRAPVPPRTFTVVARNGKEAVYTHDCSNPDMWASSLIPAVSEPGKRLADQWRQWELDYERAARELHIPEIDAEDNRFSEQLYAARSRLIAAPVENAAELLEKLETLWEDGIDADTFKDEIIRDVRALAAPRLA